MRPPGTERDNMDMLTVNGVDYLADQYDSVYEMTDGAWMHVGKLNGRTLAQVVADFETEV